MKKTLSKRNGKNNFEIENHNNNGSNWIFNEIISLHINTVEYKPLKYGYSSRKLAFEKCYK